MAVVAGLIAYALPLVLLVAAIVWAVNLSQSVRAIQGSLERIEKSRTAAASAPSAPAAPSAPSTPAPGPASSTPIDIDPFVD